MKNRITTPDGIRIVLEAIKSYEIRYEEEDSNHWPLELILSLKDGTNISVDFDSEEDEDGNISVDEDGLMNFLARLDNYFQEIP